MELINRSPWWLGETANSDRIADHERLFFRLSYSGCFKDGSHDVGYIRALVTQAAIREWRGEPLKVRTRTVAADIINEGSMNQAGILVTVVYWHYEAIVLTAKSETAAKHMARQCGSRAKATGRCPADLKSVRFSRNRTWPPSHMRRIPER